MLSGGFLQVAPLLPLGAFNCLPQCLGLGRTSQGAYAFASNVAPEALRLVSQGFQAPTFRRGVTDITSRKPIAVHILNRNRPVALYAL
jgi:hypothetical protein